jgi:hypothetical protein
MSYFEATSVVEGVPAAGASVTAIAGATDETGQRPDDSYVLRSVAILIAGFVVGGLLTKWLEPGPFTPVAGVGMFAVFYVVTQALERLFELTRLIFPNLGATEEGGDKKNKEEAQVDATKARAAALNAVVTQAGNVPDLINAAAESKKVVSKVAANTAVIAWAINSFLAAVACGALGLYFLKAIGVQDVSSWVDIAVSSLVIGGGTKPLHDLIKNIEKAKEEKSDT